MFNKWIYQFIVTIINFINSLDKKRIKAYSLFELLLTIVISVLLVKGSLTIYNRIEKKVHIQQEYVSSFIDKIELETSDQ